MFQLTENETEQVSGGTACRACDCLVAVTLQNGTATVGTFPVGRTHSHEGCSDKCAKEYGNGTTASHCHKKHPSDDIKKYKYRALPYQLK